MIRYVHCIKARPEVSGPEFRRLFHGKEMESLIARLADLTEAVDYKLSLTLEIQLNLRLMEERGGASPFDALVEIRWTSGRALMSHLENEAFGALMDELEAFQQTFVDFSRSSRFFVEE